MKTCGNCGNKNCDMKDFSESTKTNCMRHTVYDFEELLERKRNELKISEKVG
ncbi:MAG: hypothetical protein ACRC0V_04510 [Fusobacteriaceae bacterium]